MGDYIVSARKYRPRNFELVVGQEALTTTLKNAIATGKIAQAYLFCGPRGVGKTTCARIFAKTINCMKLGADGEACDECESCRSFNEQRSLNVFELDAASNNSVDDIRQLVDQVRIPPQIGKYKVYIIDEVHMLSQQAFNAFLKTLEEPPRHAVFILATTEKQKIIPTILSRCQTYDFSRISTEDIIRHLGKVADAEGIQYETEALGVIAQKADGGMRDALSIFDQVVSFSRGNITYRSVIENLNVLDYDYYFRLTDYLVKGEIAQSLLLLNDVLKKGFDGGNFIAGLGAHLRDVMVSKDESTLPLLEAGPTVRERYRAAAKACSLKFLYRAMRLCNESSLGYRNSKNKRFHVECTLIQLAQLSEDDDVTHGPWPEKTPPLKPIKLRPAASAESSGRQQEPEPVPSTASTGSGAGIPKAIYASPQEKKTVSELDSLTVSIKAPVMESAALQPTSPKDGGHEDRSMPYSREQFLEQWAEEARAISQSHNALGRIMQLEQPQANEDGVLEFTLPNEIAVQEFRGILPQVLGFLRDRLRNDHIEIRPTVARQPVSINALSRKDQLELLTRKYSVFKDLTEELGLELD